MFLFVRDLCKGLLRTKYTRQCNLSMPKTLSEYCIPWVDCPQFVFPGQPSYMRIAHRLEESKTKMKIKVMRSHQWRNWWLESSCRNAASLTIVAPTACNNLLPTHGASRKRRPSEFHHEFGTFFLMPMQTLADPENRIVQLWPDHKPTELTFIRFDSRLLFAYHASIALILTMQPRSSIGLRYVCHEAYAIKFSARSYWKRTTSQNRIVSRKRKAIVR